MYYATTVHHFHFLVLCPRVKAMSKRKQTTHPSPSSRTRKIHKTEESTRRGGEVEEIREMVSIPPFEEWVPEEILLLILSAYVHPWGTEIARLVCRRWNRVIQGFPPHIFGYVQVADILSCGEAKFFRSMDGVLAGCSGDHFFGLDLERFRACVEYEELLIKRPKNAGDYLVEMGAPLSTIQWASEQGALRIGLPLFHMIRRDDAEALRWLFIHKTKIEKAKEIKEIKETRVVSRPTESQTLRRMVYGAAHLIAQFSSRRCLEAVRPIFTTRQWMPGRTFRETFDAMVFRSIIANGNLDFLKERIKEFDASTYFKLSKNELIEEAQFHDQYDIMIYLVGMGMKIPSLERFIHGALSHGHLGAIEWALSEHKDESIKILFTLFPATGGGTRMLKPENLRRALRGLNVDIIRLLGTHGYATVTRMEDVIDFVSDSAIWREHSTNAELSRRRIAMVEYMLSMVKTREMGSTRTYGSYFIPSPVSRAVLSCFVKGDHLDELKWWKARGEEWVVVEEVLEHGAFDIFEWYLDELGETIKDHWTCVPEGFRKLASCGRLGLIKRLYHECGCREYVSIVIPTSIVTNRTEPLEWIWSLRDELFKTRKDWTILNVYYKWSSVLRGRRGTSRAHVWFHDHVSQHPEFQEVTLFDVDALAKSDSEWDRIILELYIVKHSIQTDFRKLFETLDVPGGIFYPVFSGCTR
jgi:hypothetical protein